MSIHKSHQGILRQRVRAYRGYAYAPAIPAKGHQTMLGKETSVTPLGNPIAYFSILPWILGGETIQDAPTEHPPLAKGEVAHVR